MLLDLSELSDRRAIISYEQKEYSVRLDRRHYNSFARNLGIIQKIAKPHNSNTDFNSNPDRFAERDA